MKGKGAQQQGIYDTKNSSFCDDAESEGGDGRILPARGA
jgi:hypothetical protein